jgi:putative membrane protein
MHEGKRAMAVPGMAIARCAVFLQETHPMKSTTLLAVAAAAALFAAGPVAAQTQDKSAATQKSAKGGQSRDAKEMKELAIANMAEIEAGKLALEKAQDPKVKEFAQHMVDDHTKMLDEVKQLAQSKNVELPNAPDAKHQKLMKKLQGLSGEKFDREYMQAMVKDHRDSLKLAQRTAKGAKDEELKSAAQKAAPEIQDHLKMAQDISKSEKRSATGRTGGNSGAGGAAR